MITLAPKISEIVKNFEKLESNKNNSSDRLIRVKNTNERNIHNINVKNTIEKFENLTFKKIITEDNLSEVDKFCKKLDNFTLKMKKDNSENNLRAKILLSNYNEDNNHHIITIKKSDSLGHGAYGNAYRIDDFVIKIYHADINFKDYIYADPERCARILNQINNDPDFSRSITLDDGKKILISKFIEGTSIVGKEALEFVKSRGRIIFDCHSVGNVIKDKSGKYYLIDADLVAMPTGLSRTLSMGTIQIHNDCKDVYNDPELKARYFKSLHYPEIQNIFNEKNPE